MIEAGFNTFESFPSSGLRKGACCGAGPRAEGQAPLSSSMVVDPATDRACLKSQLHCVIGSGRCKAVVSAPDSLEVGVDAGQHADLLVWHGITAELQSCTCQEHLVSVLSLMRPSTWPLHVEFVNGFFCCCAVAPVGGSPNTQSLRCLAGRSAQSTHPDVTFYR
jgi:hypothetical protein